MGAIGRAERQLNLVSALLKARNGLAWADVSAIDGYNDKLAPRSRQKRLERDLKSLAEVGLLVLRRRVDLGEFRYEIDRVRCLLPALDLSAEQRLLLFRIGLGYVQGGGAGPLRAHLSSALLKLQAGAGRAGLPATLPRAFVRRTLHRRPAEAEHVQTIGLALLERRRIKFDYQPGGGKRAGRSVAPYALVSRRGGWYLIAYDIARKAVRTFRLSRMRGRVLFLQARAAGAEYEIPTGFDAERDFSAEVFGRGQDSWREVRVRFDADVAFVVENEFEGIYEITREKSGAIVLHLPQAYPHELYRYLGEFPGHWQVLGPEGLKKNVIEHLSRALDA